ncbi:MAG: hypothetical protein ACRDH8_11610 [Actinomycetota bacterium]
MLIPIAMIVLTLTLPYPGIRWVNIAAAIFFVLFNLLGLPYPSAYDNFLIVVSFIVNALTIWYAWRWASRRNRPLQLVRSMTTTTGS